MGAQPLSADDVLALEQFCTGKAIFGLASGDDAEALYDASVTLCKALKSGNKSIKLQQAHKKAKAGKENAQAQLLDERDSQIRAAEQMIKVRDIQIRKLEQKLHESEVEAERVRIAYGAVA